ncbi:hypothetical protein B9Z07_26280 [Burkholderia cenocepacia]|uniref:Uncharacterized protein n=1 Tax=Burkholderia cenocepacia TaxID=95486 RepID=A0AAD0J8N6_9BURK|nr:hypothetical protein B9Z07_26280 [Burkholderia cenocepacia]PRE37471.1 hypothetical protein C6P63_07015 [Burkholderia cenocepacia]
MYEAICAHRPEEARTAMQTHIGCVRSHFERERRTARLVGPAPVPARAATCRASRITSRRA